jgi:hypothetical protein
MFHVHPSAFGLGPEDPAEDRERMHRIALHEARIATDHRSGAHDDLALANARPVARLRFAIPGGRTADLDACCA